MHRGHLCFFWGRVKLEEFCGVFISDMLFVTMCKKTHSKIVQGSLAILRSLSTCKIMKIHHLRKLDRCIAFFWECSLAKLGSYIISAMLLAITCKRTHFKIFLHRFPIVSKCLGACQLRKTMKYEISGNFSSTWSQKFHWLFQVISYFDMKSFLKHYLEHDRITQYCRIQYHTLLAKRNASFGKKTQIFIHCNGIWAVFRTLEHDIGMRFSRCRENHSTYWDGVFCDLLQISISRYDPARVTWPWPWVAWQAGECMMHFFWDWV